MGLCIANPPNIPAPTSDVVEITMTIPGFAHNPDAHPKYIVKTELTSDYNDDGCINLENYGGNAHFIINIDPSLRNNVRFFKEKSTSLTFKALHVINDNATWDHEFDSKSQSLRKRQFQCWLHESCAWNTDPHKIVAWYDNSTSVGLYLGFGFKYEIKPNGGSWRVKYTPDPGIKNGGQSFHPFPASLVGLIFSLLAPAALFYFVRRHIGGRVKRGG